MAMDDLMSEAFKVLRSKIEARKEKILPARQYVFGDLGLGQAETRNRTIDDILSIVSEVESEYCPEKGGV